MDVVLTGLASIAYLGAIVGLPFALGYRLGDWRALLLAVLPPVALYASVSGGSGGSDFLVFGLIIMLGAAVLFTGLGVAAGQVRPRRRTRP